VAIAPNRPTSAGGAVTSWQVTPELPAGLSLDPQSGVVSGTPENVAPETTYVITASNSGGSTSTELRITVLTIADASRAMITDDVDTATPFARLVLVGGSYLDRLSRVGYRIAP